jgi:transcriptional regulator with XRE-family HTH domain
MLIGNRIRKERLLKGYSQDWLASQLHVSQNLISDIENGKIDIRLGKLEEIAKVLEINPWQLIEFDKGYYNNVVNTQAENATFNSSSNSEELIFAFKETIEALKREAASKDEIIALLKKEVKANSKL